MFFNRRSPRSSSRPNTARRAHPRLESLEDRLVPAFIVNTTADSGPGSLRQAILDANASAGFDSILFKLPGTGLHTIAVASPLPALTDPAGTLIDGYSQDGAWANTLAVGDNAVLTVELDGSGVGAGANGLVVTGGNTTLKGLVIHSFGGSGVYLSDTGGNAVVGCFIGTNPAGDAPAGNVAGVWIGGTSAGNVLGGTAVADRNLISGNLITGLRLDSPSNVLWNNYIGTDASGLAAVPNTSDPDASFPTGAVELFSGNNTIGGSAAGTRNVISGNRYNGILAWNTGDLPNIYQGNYIGLGADGSTPLPNVYGIYLALATRNNVIGGSLPGEGNVISANGGFGIVLDGADPYGGRGAVNTTIQGNLIGTDATGLLPRGNVGQGIYAFATKDLVIGGSTAVPGTGPGNVITANTGSGILLAGTSGSVVAGNLIGLGTDGETVVGAQTLGLYVTGDGNVIGGGSASERNIISGNTEAGVLFEGPGATGNTAAGNFIGTDASGMLARGNLIGVRVSNGASDNAVGTLGTGNVIAASGADGVLLTGSDTLGNFVVGNAIGTDAGHTLHLANGHDGVAIDDGAHQNVVAGNASKYNGRSGVYLGIGVYGTTVGGVDASKRNVLSGNTLYGVEIGHQGGDAVTSGNTVQGNYIGTTDTGRAADPNGIGVLLQGEARGNLIGGTAAGAGNLISGNTNYGVALVDPGVSGNHVQRNRIGTNVAGTGALGNGLSGVFINVGAHNNQIGSGPAGAINSRGNVIAYNGADGVTVGSSGLGNGCVGNSIRGNSIFSNSDLGIDLADDGVTPNDPLDRDRGPNGLQNTPLLTSAMAVSGGTEVSGTLQSRPNTRYTLDFYASPSADPSGYGEGKKYLGRVEVTTDASGVATFSSVLATSAPAGWVIASTATDRSGNTSEFSPALVLGCSSSPLSAAPEGGPMLVDLLFARGTTWSRPDHPSWMIDEWA
jgi:titin